MELPLQHTVAETRLLTLTVSILVLMELPLQLTLNCTYISEIELFQSLF